MEAMLDMLAEKGITLDSKAINSKTRRIHSIQGSVLRYQITCRMRDPDFDLR